MWQCADCGETFADPGCIGYLNGIVTCPFCESSLIFGHHEIPAEHPMCPCIMNHVNTNSNIFEESPALSFDDMDKHEVILIDLPLISIDVRPITYISEMNERFLHTFIDADFVPTT